MPSDSHHVDIRELAKITGLPVSYLRGAAREKRIPHIRVGRSLRFIPALVEEALVEEAKTNCEEDHDG